MKRKTSLKISLFSFQDIITSVTGVMILLTLLMALELVEKIETSPPVLTEKLTDDLKEQLAKVNQQVAQLTERFNETNQLTVALTSMTSDSIQKEIESLEAELDALNVKTKDIKETQAKLDATKLQLEEAEKSKSEMESELVKIELSIKDIKNRIFKVNEGMVVLLEPRKGDTREPWIIEVFENKILVVSTRNSKAVFTLNDARGLERWLRNRKPNHDYFFLLGHRGSFDLLRDIRELLVSHDFDYGIDLLLDNQKAVESQQVVNQ